ncbi:MAG: cyclic pyranopterin monophosphate synthase MoaC [Nitriliruptorales bacterium]
MSDSQKGPTSGSGPERDVLTHFDEAGRARMIDLGGKPVTVRSARARCQVLVSPDTAARLVDGTLPKGDAVAVARIAGIQAAKRTADLIPLCHPVRLDTADVDLAVDVTSGVVELRSEARATDRTGVEMEALVAASVAALALYDMVKSVDRGARITDLRLLEKTGGMRGDWRAPSS